MSDVFDMAVMLAEQDMDTLPAELVDMTIDRGTHELEIMPTLLCSLPVADADDPLGQYVEASLRIVTHWSMSSKAEKLAVIVFLDICADRVAAGEIIPQAVYGSEFE